MGVSAVLLGDLSLQGLQATLLILVACETSVAGLKSIRKRPLG